MYAEQEIVIAKNVVHQKNVIPSSVQLNSCADILLQQLQAASCALEFSGKSRVMISSV